jgi:HTH-type transcriptional regulator/antitoxin HigA
MGNKKENRDFMPTVAIAPGETIREEMEYMGMNQKELATRLDITTKHLSNILNGNAPITYETALKLESVLGPSAQFWMNLETNYQLDKARLEEKEKMAQDLEILKEIPYKEMCNFKWVENTSDRKERVINCRSHFGVSELSSIRNSYAAAFRKQKEIKEISDLGTLAWLRKAEVEGLNKEVEKFSKRKLKSLIPVFRELTLKDPEEFYPEMEKLCAECGIALVLVPYLPKTYIKGATIWRNNKAIIALSVMGKKADRFWFTFFHEVAHLLLHSSKDFHISYNNDEVEDEADSLARDYLISKEQYDEFLDKYDYRNKDNIIAYSNDIGVAPYILLGRLQYDKLLDYSYFNDLIPSFEIGV